MSALVRSVWLFLSLWLALPALLWWATKALDSLHVFVLHQIYYLPLGTWIKEPFFRPDSEVLFFVLPAGRVLTALFYTAVIWAAVAAWRGWKRRRH